MSIHTLLRSVLVMLLVAIAMNSLAIAGHEWARLVLGVSLGGCVGLVGSKLLWGKR